MAFEPLAASRDAARPTVIRPGGDWRFVEWAELSRYRELLGFLIWKDLKVRYKQTLLGAGWVVLQPVIAMLIFSLIFGRLARMPSDGLPYPVFAYLGLLPWSYFSRTLTAAPASLVGNPNLIRKVYFPRYLIPLATVIGGLVDLALATLLLALLLPLYSVDLAGNVALLPLFVVSSVCTAIGASFWLSALNVRYRDIRTLLPFLVQIWMYASPIVYPTSLIPEGWRLLYALNPMVGAIEGFRWSVAGGAGPSLGVFAVSTASSLALFATGLLYFRRSESAFADVL